MSKKICWSHLVTLDVDWLDSVDFFGTIELFIESSCWSSCITLRAIFCKFASLLPIIESQLANCLHADPRLSLVFEAFRICRQIDPLLWILAAIRSHNLERDSSNKARVCCTEDILHTDQNIRGESQFPSEKTLRYSVSSLSTGRHLFSIIAAADTEVQMYSTENNRCETRAASGETSDNRKNRVKNFFCDMWHNAITFLEAHLSQYSRPLTW